MSNGQHSRGVDSDDICSARRELLQLRRGRQLLASRAREARQELALARQRQVDAQESYEASEARVQALAKELGCEAEGLLEIDEWRELANAHRSREVLLDEQLQQEKTAFLGCIEELQHKIARAGRHCTAHSKEAEQICDSHCQADESCARLQAVRDYIDSRLRLSVDELPSVSGRPDELHQAMEFQTSSHQSTWLKVVVKDLEAAHRRSMHDLVKTTNATVAKKDTQLKMLRSNILDRSLADLSPCSPAEETALQELLVIAQNVVAEKISKLSVGISSHMPHVEE